ncbi:MAG TPA: flagellin [candidate division Zixibacteria bacterium]|nr:flagellin [candidate division Zixibacteria bacterium]
MAIVINTNVASLNAQRHLSNTQFGLAKSLERLSSGFRINRAGDDAAGLAISERLKAQIRSTNQASRNTLDGVSLVQVAEGGYDEVSNILIRLRELAVQSANGTISANDRGAIDTEYDQLTAEITRIAAVVKFNGVQVLNGDSSGAALSFSLQVGIGTTSNDTISISINPLKASALGSSSLDLTALSLTTASGATDAITTLDSAIDAVNSSRAALGAVQNRLEATSRSLAISVENLSAANSRIRDVDVAAETAELARYQILAQAGAAIAAQANQVPSLALSLLGS